MMIDEYDSEAEPHLTPEQVHTLLGFVQQFNPIVVGGQAVNIWAVLYHGIDDELDGLGALTSKDLDFYHNREAERVLAASLEDGLLEIPDGDNHTPNAAVVKGSLGGRRIVVDFLAQIKGVEDKSLLENSITFADEEDPDNVSITLMHPLDCVRSRLSNINMLGRRSEHSLRQAVASILILDCYIGHQLSLSNDTGLKRVQNALRELGLIIREKHIGKPTEQEFGEVLDPTSILRKYRDDERIDVRFRDNQIKGILDMLEERKELAERRRKMTIEREKRALETASNTSIPRFR